MVYYNCTNCISDSNLPCVTIYYIHMALGNSTVGNESSIREGRHPTGIGILDDEELKGIKEGTTIAIIGDPDSSAELLLHALAATGRKTKYISTLRSERGLKKDILNAKRDKVEESEIESNLSIKDAFSAPESIDDIIRKELSAIGDGNLIIDSFSRYHDTSKDLLSMARTIHMKTKKNKGLTYIYFVAEDTTELNRFEKEILQMVDGVFNIKSENESGERIDNKLFINKLRGVKLPGETYNLNFGKRVTVQATSDIG